VSDKFYTIQHLKRKEVDLAKYDACIASAINTRIYAYSWYLDVVAKDWSVLVLDDYKAVMPLPYMRAKKHVFIKKIIQPHFCQQLGVFYKKTISQAIFDDFYSNFTQLTPKSYNFNAQNFKFSHDIKRDVFMEKVNYELNLDKSYEDLFLGYSKNLKRNLKKTLKHQLKITTVVSIDDFISLKDANKQHRIKNRDYEIIKNLLREISSRNQGSFIGVLGDDEILAMAFFIKTNKRIVQLFSVATPKGKQYAATAFLFDNLIKEHANTNYIFDFEGSMIPGVARFFKSFGAHINPYYSYKK